VNRSELDGSMGVRISRLCIPAVDDDHGVSSIQRPLIDNRDCSLKQVGGDEEREMDDNEAWVQWVRGWNGVHIGIGMV
jgi:hypothetical protein